MSAITVTSAIASLNAGHPLNQILAQQVQADVNDPVAQAYAQTVPALLLAGDPELGPGDVDQADAQGLTAAGVGAVLALWNTYLTGLTAGKKAQLGTLRCNVTSVGLLLSVHPADVSAQAASLQTTLNTGANYGPIGT